FYQPDSPLYVRQFFSINGISGIFCFRETVFQHKAGNALSCKPFSGIITLVGDPYFAMPPAWVNDDGRTSICSGREIGCDGRVIHVGDHVVALVGDAYAFSAGFPFGTGGAVWPKQNLLRDDVLRFRAKGAKY